MSKAESVLMIDAIFTILLVAFGANGGLNKQSLQSLTSLPLPVLSPQPTINGNSINAISNIVLATAYVGWAITNIPVLIGYMIAEFVLFVNLMLAITFNPAFNANGVPFLGFFFIGLQIYVIFELFRIFRGSSSGI